MFTLALVQNQSEMVHYGYADARPLFYELGYELEHYTADNISMLGSALQRGQFDAIVLGSNALNDKTIKQELENSNFISAFREWIVCNNGKGFLCLHQLRVAQEPESSLKFLPAGLCKITASVRPRKETSANGDISFAANGSESTLALYPNSLDPAAIKEAALSYLSLPGLYWHYWSNVNLSEWELLFIDASGSDDRALVLSSRDIEKGRIVLSSLALDWQKQRDALKNILTFVIEGKHNTAFLSNPDTRNTAFDYLIGTLESKKYPFRNYGIDQNLNGFVRHLKNSVHNTLIVGPYVDIGELDPVISKTIRDRLDNGRLKLVNVDNTARDSKGFSISGKERSAHRLLNTMELKVQAELREGYIDGSFWSTAETLQILEEIEETHASYESLVGEALGIAKDHDRNGSYDEVFGVTCAFLWMKGKFLGVEAKETKECVVWIRERVSSYEPREQIGAYTALDSIGLITKDERQIVSATLNKVANEELSEIDLVVYLKAALLFENYAVVPNLINKLSATQKENGSWVDLATTATAVSTLIDALSMSQTSGASYSAQNSKIEKLIFSGIIYIQNSYHDSITTSLDQNYPWDGKASTAAKCILAWLKFEDLIDLPVDELVDVLGKHNTETSSYYSGRQALSVLEDLKKDNEGLHLKLAETESSLKSESIYAKRSRRNLALMLLLSYVLACVLIGSNFIAASSGPLALIKVTFFDNWQFHLAVVAIVVSGLGLPHLKAWANARIKKQ